MTESEIIINCNKLNELSTGSHFVDEKLSPDVTPSIDENIILNKTTGKMLKKGEKYQDGNSSTAKSPRSSSKKRKRSEFKARIIDSEDSNDDLLQFDEPLKQNDQQGRKKRSRRRKNRKYKPYNKLSWSERREQEDRETRRANRIRAQRFANGQAVAPYNTTQFLMEDHNDLKDIDVKQPPLQQNQPLFPRQRGQRARDSSFSLESEEDFYYSSPEDEKEFLTKEFSTVYEDLHAEQLSTQPKTKLVQDLLILEKKYELLEKENNELRRKKDKSSSESEPGTSDERVVLYKTEITKLSEENNRLRAENECLRRKCAGEDENQTLSTSSIDSESDSTASSSGSCSSSSDNDELQQPAASKEGVSECSATSANKIAELKQPMEVDDATQDIGAGQINEKSMDDTSVKVNNIE